MKKWIDIIAAVEVGINMQGIKIVSVYDKSVIASRERMVRFVNGEVYIESYCGDYDGDGCGKFLDFLTLEKRKSFYASTCDRCVKEQKGW